MLLLGVFYLLALVSLPVSLGVGWWAWLRGPRLLMPKWRSVAYSSGLCAGTANFILYWAFVAWLQFHYTDQAHKYKVEYAATAVGLFLLLYSCLAVSISKGPHRLLVGAACILAMLPWIPLPI
jgi:hypothetical protein